MCRLKEKGFYIDDLYIEKPIIQGGMGVGVSLSGLASAVCNEGGVGVVSSAGIGLINGELEKKGMQYSYDGLKNEITKLKRMTNGVTGVNIMVALTDFNDMVKASIEAGVDIIISGAGLPLTLPSLKPKDSKTKLVPIVSSRKAVKAISKWWISKYDYVPDAFVLEGPKAGGHLGFKLEDIDNKEYDLFNLIPQIVEEVKKIEDATGRKIPVIAAGGIFTGEDIKKALDLGATAVQMATRFVATEECDADYEFKKMYVDCKKEDIGIIKSPVGLPGRAIINDYTKEVYGGERKPVHCPYHCIITCDYKTTPYCISLALLNAYKGKMNNGFCFIGENGYKVEKITTVKEIFDSLEEEYKIACKGK